eukprot:gene6202-266_t
MKSKKQILVCMKLLKGLTHLVSLPADLRSGEPADFLSVSELHLLVPASPTWIQLLEMLDGRLSLGRWALERHSYLSVVGCLEVYLGASKGNFVKQMLKVDEEIQLCVGLPICECVRVFKGFFKNLLWELSPHSIATSIVLSQTA